MVVQPLKPDEKILTKEGEERIKDLVNTSLEQPLMRGELDKICKQGGNLIDVFQHLKALLQSRVSPSEYGKIEHEATLIIEETIGKFIVNFLKSQRNVQITLSGEPENLRKDLNNIAEAIRREAAAIDPQFLFVSLQEIYDNYQLRSQQLSTEIQPALIDILAIQRSAREAQKDTPERWEKVVEQGGKYYWHTVPDKFEAWQEGYEGSVLIGEVPTTNAKRKELSQQDELLYKNYKNQKETEKQRFYEILKEIATKIKIDVKQAAADTTGQYIKDKAHEFFNNLKDDDKKIFARFEGLLKNDAYDNELCIRKVLSYLNESFGNRGEFVERREYLTKEEKAELLDKLDIAEDIVRQLIEVMTPQGGAPPKRYDLLAKLKKAISTCGAEKMEIHLKYINIRGLSEGMYRIDDSTMLYFIDYMFQLRDNGITSNVKMPGAGDMGCKPAPGEWKVKDHIDEFNRDMAVYREFMAFMREDDKYKNETPGKWRERLKKMCEEYKKPGSEGEKLYKELSDKTTGMKNFSDAIIAELYKALLLFEKTPINIRRREFNETSKGEPETTPDIDNKELNKLRDDYARRRRGLRAFFIKHTKEHEINQARTDYINGYRQRITHNITSDNNLQKMAIDSEKERKDFRLAVRRKVVSQLLAERKKLFTKELEVHKESQWQKLKTWFRKHPYIRLGVGAGATVAGIGAVALGIPMVAVPLVLARMGMWQIGWEGGWEAMQNKFGKTRSTAPWKLKFAGVKEAKKMDIKESRERLAAHSTLAIGTRPGFDKSKQKIGKLDQFYGGATGQDIWTNYTKHLNETIDGALKKLPPEALKSEIVEEAVKTGMREEINFMKDVEGRERHMRMTDALKKVTGLVSGFLLFGKDLFPAKATPEEAIQGDPPRPVAEGEPPPDQPPYEPPPEPPEPYGRRGPDVVGGGGGGGAEKIQFRMIENISHGDPDPGVLQAMSHKLGLTASQARDLAPTINETVSNMKGIYPGGFFDSHGVWREGISYVKGGDLLDIPNAEGFIAKIKSVTGLSRDEIIRKLGS